MKSIIGGCRLVFLLLLFGTLLWASDPTGISIPVPELAQKGREWLETLIAKSRSEHASRFGLFSYQSSGNWIKAETLSSSAVILVHGLDEPGWIWDDLAPLLQQDGVPVYSWNYANDQDPRQSGIEFRQALHEFRLRGLEHALIVAHSMGGLVTKTAMCINQEIIVPDIQTIISVGTPFNGSPFARFRWFAELKELSIRAFRDGITIDEALSDGTGEAGKALLPDSEYIQWLNEQKLPPTIHWLAIAGKIAAAEQEMMQIPTRLPSELKFAEPWFHKCQTSWRSMKDEFGDGVVSVDSALPEWANDKKTIEGNHHGMLHRLWSFSAQPNALVIIEAEVKSWLKTFNNGNSNE